MAIQQVFIFIAAVNGLVAVALGAFGAHALKAKLTPTLLAVWQTAVQYHFYHVFALLIVALLLKSLNNAYLHWSGIVFTLGLLLFCGSLYALALGGPKWLGPITPLGGLFFMIGWGLLAAGALKATL